MKLPKGCLALTLAFAACGGGRDDTSPANASTTNTQTTTTTTQAETANAATPSPTATASPAAVAAERPFEVTYTGATPDKGSITYKIKVNYEREDPLPEGATRAEITLKRVHFKDGTVWNAE